MYRFWIFVFLVIFSYKGKSQSFNENDSLPSKIVIGFPETTLTVSQLNSLKTEFAKYSQITRAVFVYGNHNILLIDLNMNLNNPDFIYYRELIKPMSSSINPADIRIKTPLAYDEILSSVGQDDNTTTFLVK